MRRSSARRTRSPGRRRKRRAALSAEDLRQPEVDPEFCELASLDVCVADGIVRSADVGGARRPLAASRSHGEDARAPARSAMATDEARAAGHPGQDVEDDTRSALRVVDREQLVAWTLWRAFRRPWAQAGRALVELHDLSRRPVRRVANRCAVEIRITGGSLLEEEGDVREVVLRRVLVPDHVRTCRVLLAACVEGVVRSVLRNVRRRDEVHAGPIVEAGPPR